MSKHDLKNYWGADPVHLAPRGYEKLAEKLVGKLEAERSKKRSREDCEAGKQRQKPRLDHSDRKTGISRSDTVAERWEGSSGQSGHGGRSRAVPARIGGLRKAFSIQ